MLDTVMSGLAHLGTLPYWYAVVAGVLLATVVGLIPGVGTPLMMSVLIPFVVFTIQDPLIGIVLLATIAGVSNTLDSIPAVLMGYPGAATQVTYLEGHQLARKGLAARTLGTIYVVSAMGGVVGAIALVLIIPIIRPFILNFSFAEIAAMAMFGVAMVSVLSRGAMLKGVVAGLFGLLLSTTGMHYGTAIERFTFDILELSEGLPLITVTLGIFALPEVLDLCAARRAVAKDGTAVISNREVFAGAREGLRHWKITIRHSLFGVFLGAVPGIGSAVVDWLSYALGIALAKDKTQFGKGSLEGVIFAEAAQNSKEGGQAIPTLAFGVPGGVAWIFVLTAMLAYGIAPGPQMLGQHADITIMLAVSFGIGNLLITGIGLVLTGQLAKLTRIPYVMIGAVVIPVTLLSAFQETGGWLGIVVLLVFTAVGIAMKAFGWPRPPLLLGFILGGIIEANLESAISAYGLVGTLTRPITLTLVVIMIVTVYLMQRIDKSNKLAAMVKAERQAETGGMRAQAEIGSKPDAPLFSVGGVWRLEHWFGLFVLLTLGYVVWAVFGFEYGARIMPFFAASGALVLLSFELLLRRKAVDGEIMDIALVSVTVEGSGRTAGLIASFIVLMLLMTATVGMQWATITFAVIFPIFMSDVRGRWLASIVAGIFVSVISLGLLDGYMSVLWPEPLLWNWLQGVSY